MLFCINIFFISFANAAVVPSADQYPEKLAPIKSTKSFLRVLPLITFYDVAKDTTYNWWSEFETQSVDARKHSEQMLRVLGFGQSKTIRFLNPYARGIQLRGNLKKTNLTSAELLEISTSLDVGMVIVGDVTMDKSPVILDGQRLKINLQILQAPSFAPVGEVMRVMDLYALDYNKLVDEGGDVWLTVRTSLENKITEKLTVRKTPLKLELVVTGHLDQEQMQKFQSLLKQQLPNIKESAKSFIDNDSFGIFVEYAGQNVQGLSEELRGIRVEGFMTQVVSSTNSQVIFDVRPIKQ